jgi:hypothetical protein
MLPSHASVASRPSRPRHRLTRLISRSAHKTPPFSHIIPYPPPQLARPRPRPRSRPRSRCRCRLRLPAPAPAERHETPDPVRPNAVDPRFHCVLRHASGALRPAPCARARRPAAGRPGTHSAQPTRANPSANRTNAEPERKPSATPSFAANLFSQPVMPPPITLSCQPRDQARSVSRVFRVRCQLVTC